MQPHVFDPTKLCKLSGVFSVSLVAMAKKKSGKKGKGSAKGDKKGPPKKARPTRCPPDFKWEKRPLLVEVTTVSRYSHGRPQAVMANDVTRCQKLIARGEDINEALHYAVGRGRLECVQLFIEAGADLHTDIRDGDYWIPPPAEPKKEKKKSGKKGKKKK